MPNMIFACNGLSSILNFSPFWNRKFYINSDFLKYMVKLSQQEFKRSLAEAQKDPQFRKDIRSFIKVTTGSYKLKEYNLDN